MGKKRRLLHQADALVVNTTKKKKKGQGDALVVRSEVAKGSKGSEEQLAEIDDLFASASAKKKQKRKAEEGEREKFNERKRKNKKYKGEGVENEQNDLKPVRFDNESGLPVYTEESLRIGQGGGTADCPFDCTCCY